MENPTPPPNSKGFGFTTGVLLGALAGTSVSLLLGTKQGKKYLQELRQDAHLQFQHLKAKHPKQVQLLRQAYRTATSQNSPHPDNLNAPSSSTQSKRPSTNPSTRRFVQSGRPVKVNTL